MSQRETRRRGVGRAGGAADLKGAQARRAEAALNLGYTKVEAPLAGIGGPLAGERRHAGRRPRHAADDGDADRPDEGALRHRRHRPDEAGAAKWPRAACSCRSTSAFDVEVKLADGSVYPRKGKLLFSDTRVSGDTGTVEAEAEVPNPDGVLKPGQFVRVRLHGASGPSVAVPQRAVLDGPQGKFVYVAAEGKAAPQAGAGGRPDRRRLDRQPGPRRGRQVIVDGMARIFFPGAPIQIAQAAAGAQRAARRVRRRPRAAPEVSPIEPSRGPRMFSRFFIDRPIFAAVLSIFIVHRGPGRDARRCRSRSTPRSRRRWSP